MIVHVDTMRLARSIAKALPKLNRGDYFKCAMEIARAIQEWHKEQHGKKS